MRIREPDDPHRGRCQKCGREFLTMPKDGIDHYGFGDQRECGGSVINETQESRLTNGQSLDGDKR